MRLFLLLISIFWLSVGISALIIPLKLKTFYTNLIKPVKPLFILPTLIGLLLLLSAPISRLELLIKLLGILALIKGLFILISPKALLSSTFNYFLGRSDTWWRVYGVFVILLGVVVIFSIL